MIDSKVPRDTKRLVAGVSLKKENVRDMSLYPIHVLIDKQEPELVNGILTAIQSISDEARRALADPELSREALLNGLGVRYLPSQPLISC